MRYLSVDIETFSSVDLKKAGAYRYVQSPDFQILLLAFAWNDGPVHLIDLVTNPDDPALPAVINALKAPDVIKRAYNAAFEWYCLSKYWPTPIEQWRCTMAHGLYCGYTAGLGKTCEAVGLPQDKRKLGTGLSLIRTFCVPQKPTQTNGQRTRIYPRHEPDRWALFKQYCIRDVEAERALANRLAPWPMPEKEQRLWELDTLTNARGIAVDRQLVEGALWCGNTAQEALLAEARSISGLENPKSTKQLLTWLQKELEDELDEDLDNIRKDTVTDLLARGIRNEDAARLLELRQQFGKTSTTKYAAMDAAVCEDGRVRGLLQYYGANRTGRYAGRLVQIQNLPRNHMNTLPLARELVRDKKLSTLRLLYGNVPDTLSQLIRTAFVPAPGKSLLVADFSAIEARVVAWLAGEQWVIDVFASHGKIYEAAAAQMFGVPIERIVKGNPEYELRQRGKVATLGLGYGMGAEKLRSYAEKQYRITFSEEEAHDIVRQWRAANPNIVRLWYAVERCAMDAVEQYGQTATHGLLFTREGDLRTDQDFLTVTLPSGRKLFYARPYLAEGKFEGRQALYYWGMDQQTKKWASVGTFGGKLVENCLAGDTLVITNSGLVPLRDVRADSLVWDGIDWVNHEGVIDQGRRETISVGSLRLTPDHKILTTKGWKRCGESQGLEWAPAASHHNPPPSEKRQKRETPLAGALRLRERIRARRVGHPKERSSEKIMRLLNGRLSGRSPNDPRDDAASGLLGLALNAGQVSASVAPGLPQLWRTRNHRVSGMGCVLRGLLGRHGANLPTRVRHRQERQRPRVLPRELPLGFAENKREESPVKCYCGNPSGADDRISTIRDYRNQHDNAVLPDRPRMADRISIQKGRCSERVYDIRNCGPRRRFAVWDDGDVRIVSNCVQAIARDCLTDVLTKLADRGYAVVAHIHDEVIVEGEPEQLPDILAVMAEPLPWAPGLLLKGDGFSCDFYRKE